MSVIRVSKDKNNPYLIINKSGLNDEKLSLKAKGLLCYLLGLPDDWEIYENELVKHHKDGKDSIKSAIKELIDNKYIERERKRDSKGRLRGYDYIVYEINQNGKTYVGKSNVGESAPTNIITKPINKGLNNKSFIGNEPKISFNKFLKSNNLSQIDNAEAIEAIQYYDECYINIFNTELKYTVNEWKDILEGIFDNDTGSDADLEILKDAINKHFETKYKYKEMYLLHNFTGKVKDNKLYEAGIL